MSLIDEMNERADEIINAAIGSEIEPKVIEEDREDAVKE